MPFMNYANKYFFFILLILLSISFFYFGTYRNWPYKVESDGKYYYQYLVSGVNDRDVDFSNNYRASKYDWMVTDIDHYNFRSKLNNKTNRPINLFTIGPAILWTPFFLVALTLGKLLNFFGLSIDTNPYGLYMQYATMFSAVFYTLLSLFLLNKIMRRYYPETSSKLSLWLVLFMTPLYYYTVFEPSMSHVYDFFTFTLLFYFMIEYRPNRTTLFYLLLGFLGALHVLVRTQNILNIAILFFLLFIQSLRVTRLDYQQLAKYLVCLAALLIGLAPIPLINTYIYGAPFTIPQGESFLDWNHPEIASLLFSDRNGLFSQHPIFLLGIIGYAYSLIKVKYDCKVLFWGLLLVFIAQTYINATVDDWWAGHSFGQRRLLFSIPLFTFGLTYLITAFNTHFKPVYQKYLYAFASLGTLLWFYLTMIHVFIWDYEQPHNIYKWMFYYAPLAFSDYY